MKEIAAHAMPLALLALAWAGLRPPPPRDRCTLIERDHDDRSTPETRARLSDGQ